MKNNLNIVPVADIPLGENLVISNSSKTLFEIYKTCMQLQVLCVLEKGVGISAVQAGLPMKLFLVRYPQDNFRYFINCTFSPADEEKMTHLEGCLSLVNSKGQLRTFEVQRYKKIVVSGYELIDQQNELVLKVLEDYYVEGFFAAVFQHEIQHDQGILISDIGTEVDIY
jgi:peptide deformylase